MRIEIGKDIVTNYERLNLKCSFKQKFKMIEEWCKCKNVAMCLLKNGFINKTKEIKSWH